MAPLVADAGVPWVLMHWRPVSADSPHQAPQYRDVVAEVRAQPPDVGLGRPDEPGRGRLVAVAGGQRRQRDLVDRNVHGNCSPLRTDWTVRGL